MLNFKKILCILLTILIIAPLCACKDSMDAYIYFELPETPSTLDPQVASSDSELLIVRNIFEGLMRKDEKGNIVNGVCQNVIEQGLKYTFKLFDDYYWSNGEKLTANDFEFALKRAVSPETKSPFVSRIFSIKNAEKIYNGEMSADSLGVKAIDDFTLEITLEKQDELFLETLTTSIAMPCNEKFFYETSGKYGIFADCLLSNGSYKLSRWRKESFGIRLYRNQDYNGNFSALNAAVFITCNKDKDTLEQLQKNSIDIAFIDSTLESTAKESGLNTESFENICWVMTIGKDFSKEMRKSLLMLVGNDDFKNQIAEGYSVASSLFPSGIKGNISSEGMTIYNKEDAKELYLEELYNLPDKKFPSGTVMYYYDNGSVKPVVNSIVGHWQGNLSAFVNIEASTSSDSLLPQLLDNTYSFAFFPVRADSNRADEYLKKFGSTKPIDNISDSQKELLNDYSVYPILFQNTVIAYSPAIENLNAELGNGYIDFAYIVKK